MAREQTEALSINLGELAPGPAATRQMRTDDAGIDASIELPQRLLCTGKGSARRRTRLGHQLEEASSRSSSSVAMAAVDFGGGPFGPTEARVLTMLSFHQTLSRPDMRQLASFATSDAAHPRAQI